MQNNKRADRKMELNDSPGIPDREETSEDSGLPFRPMEWQDHAIQVAGLWVGDERTSVWHGKNVLSML